MSQEAAWTLQRWVGLSSKELQKEDPVLKKYA